MPIANVALTDTFDYWRTVTNSLVVALNGNILFFRTANANTVSLTTTGGFAANIFMNVITTSSFTDTSSSNIASTLAVNSVHSQAISIALAGNNYTNTVGVLVGQSSNAWANTVVLASNAYATSVGAAGNNYTNAVGAAGNNYTNAVGTAGNNYTVVVTAAGNNFAVAIGAASNTWANTVGTAGNTYTNAVGTAGNNYASILAANNAVGANNWSNTKVSSVAASSPLSSSGGTTPTLSINTAGSMQIGSLGVGTAASGTTGEIRATNDITAFYSDQRLKNIISTIPTPIEKIKQISGVLYTGNDLAKSFGYDVQSQQVGVIAQEVEKILPQIVKLAPFDTEYVDGVEVSKSGENYKTVQYEKLIPLLIEAIKHLSDEIDLLKSKVTG